MKSLIDKGLDLLIFELTLKFFFVFLGFTGSRIRILW